MANNFMANVPEELDIQALANELAELYQTKGYAARVIKVRNGARVTIEKGIGGINTILGMGESTTVTLMKQGQDTLVASFGNNEWTSKIIGFAVGLLCIATVITAIIGTTRQLALPKDIENDLATLIGE